jgi:uncharacterized protein YdhG (YjbR/CyaY superfamily)
MIVKSTDVDAYIDALPQERKLAISNIREIILKNIPTGFEEGIGYGMISYFVPHSIFPQGYHCKPKDPLPFMSLGNNKNYIVLHSLPLYGNASLVQWFLDEYETKVPSKLDMGKGCVRFKKIDQIPYNLIAQLVAKVSVDEYIEYYVNTFQKK